VADSALKAMQLTMARYLRDPRHQPPPAGVDPRRLKIYEDLVYNNIESFISSGFPVLRSLYDASHWHALVRDFIDHHRCHTPYFLEISQEFVQFLMRDYRVRASDPPFLAELAHYEWVELALDIDQHELPGAVAVDDVLAVVPRLSPLAWLLSYRFPVHLIGPEYRPAAAQGPTFLLVYRNRADQVRFMVLNATTAHLLEKIRDNKAATAGELLGTLARESGMPLQSILAFGAEQVSEFIALDAVLVSGHQMAPNCS
jgi:uncharacterized protein